MRLFQNEACKATAVTVVGIGINSLVCAASGGVGASVLDRCGYNGYSPRLAASYGALGGIFFGLVSTCLIGCYTNNKNATSCAYFTLFVAANIISGFIGFGFLGNEDHKEFDEGHVAAAFAVGSAINTIPVGCLFLCLLACAARLNKPEAERAQLVV